jgi:hypothetical protein
VVRYFAIRARFLSDRAPQYTNMTPGGMASHNAAGLRPQVLYVDKETASDISHQH